MIQTQYMDHSHYLKIIVYFKVNHITQLHAKSIFLALRTSFDFVQLKAKQVIKNPTINNHSKYMQVIINHYVICMPWMLHQMKEKLYIKNVRIY
ncbi:hypothetical protein QL285_090974 [Trifolium repens]|nr:hypothetical protein QL285_090974 [Trifolium repens]